MLHGYIVNLLETDFCIIKCMNRVYSNLTDVDRSIVNYSMLPYKLYNIVILLSSSSIYEKETRVALPHTSTMLILVSLHIL